MKNYYTVEQMRRFAQYHGSQYAQNDLINVKFQSFKKGVQWAIKAPHALRFQLDQWLESGMGKVTGFMVYTY